MSRIYESYLDLRVKQLQEINKRRNELLVEMFRLMQTRGTPGPVLPLEGDDDELQLFLERFDIEKHPETGLISNLLPEEINIPEHVQDSPAGFTQGKDTDFSPTPLQYEHRENPEVTYGAPEDPEDGGPEPSENVAIIAMEVDQSVPETPTLETPSVDGADVEPIDPRIRDGSESTVSTTFGLEPQPGSLPSLTSLMGDGSPYAGQALYPTPPPLSQISVSSRSPSRFPADLEPSPRPTKRSRSSRTESFTSPQPAPQPPSAGVSIVRYASSVQDEDVVKSEPFDDERFETPMVDEAIPETLPEITAPPLEPTDSGTQGSEDAIMDLLEPSASGPPPAPPVTIAPHLMHINYIEAAPAARPPVSFNFDDEPVVYPAREEEAAPILPFPEVEPKYPPPPTHLLPLEFQRRGKPTKSQRKREKEREKEKADALPREWAPMGVNRWGAVMRVNPVHKKVMKATKCLSTRDWMVATTELRLLRTMERIQVLKDAGQWSFRQVKKQRGVGGLKKTHGDYLLEEMKWMRTDFREERKWKLALAYELAHAVMAWHEAGTLEERVKRGICVLWKPPHQEETEVPDTQDSERDPLLDSQDMDEDVGDSRSRSTRTPLNDYGSDDDSDEEQEKSSQETVDHLEPGKLLQEALENLEEQQNSAESAFKPKVEDIEDLTALENKDGADGDAMNVDDPNTDTGPPTVTALDASRALKPTSRNPMFSRQVGGDATLPRSKSKAKANQYSYLREQIADSDPMMLFLDLDEFELTKGMAELSTEDNPTPELTPPSDLSDVFPDMQTYGFSDVAPAVQEGRKKSDRRGDRDDPNKRAEDVTYSKLTPMNIFMYRKDPEPLISTIQPALHLRDGQWMPIYPTPIFADVEIPPARPVEDNLCSLFDGSKPNAQAGPPMMPRDGRKRAAEIVWAPNDDALLRQLVERYPNNWPLIADAYNSSRVTIVTDRRTGWECMDRWTKLNGPNNRTGAADTPDDSASAAPAAASHMTTRHKRAMSSLTAVPSIAPAAGSEPKKRRRHNLMNETLRKAAKKREQAQKSNAVPRGKPTGVHDTHGQYNKMPRMTPEQLSRAKAEKEARDAQELLSARRRNDDLARQQLLRDQAQRQGLPPNAQQALPPGAQPLQAQQLPNGVQRGMPGGGPVVPPIRSSQVGISQQQRVLSAQLAGNSRISPQLAPAHAAARGLLAAQGSPPGHLSPTFPAARAPSSSPAPAPPAASPPQVHASASTAGVAHYLPGSRMAEQLQRLTPEQIQMLLPHVVQRQQQQHQQQAAQLAQVQAQAQAQAQAQVQYAQVQGQTNLPNGSYAHP